MNKLRTNKSVFGGRFAAVVAAILAGTVSVFGQYLEINTVGGQTGTSGTNWTLSDNGTVVTITTSGTAVIHPSVLENALNNGRQVVVDGSHQELSIASDVAKTSGGAARLTLKAKQYIFLASNVDITSTSGALDLIFWADSDNSQAITNTTDNDEFRMMAGSTLVTAGGRIYIAGGLDNGANGGVSGDGLPDGYAYRSEGTSIGGVNLGDPAQNGAVVVLSSSGGDITVRGMTAGSTVNARPGITSGGKLKVDAGSGRIDFQGVSTVQHGIEFTYGVAPDVVFHSSYAGSGPAVRIAGATSANGYLGFLCFNSTTGNFLVQSASSVGGGILLEGSSFSAANTGFNTAPGGTNANIQFLSGAGEIAIRVGAIGTFTSAVGLTQMNGAVQLGARANTTAVQGITPSVASSTANVVIRGNEVVWDNAKTTTASLTGTILIAPPVGTTSFSNAETLNSLNASTATGLTFGVSGNTAAFTLGSALSVAGPIAVYGGTLDINQNLTSTGTGTAILLESRGAITVASSRNITTSGGNITLKATSAGTAITSGSAGILLAGSNTLTSNGGNITLGGGYAGVQGNLYAATNVTGGKPGISLASSTIAAGGGNIALYGKCISSYDDGVFLSAVNITTTGAGTLSVYGEAVGGYSSDSPDRMYGGITYASSSSTVSTVDGDLILDGRLTNTSGNIVPAGAVNLTRSTGSGSSSVKHSFLSRTGDILIYAAKSAGVTANGLTQGSTGDVYVGSPSDNSWTATGDITYQVSAFAQSTHDFVLTKTTGDVAYIPVGTAFTAEFAPSDKYILAASASSLVIGSATNTFDVTLNSPISVTGPVTVYGASITVNDAISASGAVSVSGSTISLSGAISASGPVSVSGSTITVSKNISTTGASDIQLLATASFLTSNTRKDITTAGGNIVIDADYDANGTGLLSLDYLTLNAGTGTTTVRGSTMSWVTTNNTDKPYINGTGAFVFEPSAANFGQDVATYWFHLDQDNNGMGSITVGKPASTTREIIFGHSGGHTSTGNIKGYGATVTLSTAVTASGNNVTLQAATGVTQSAAITASTLELAGAGYFTLTNTSNNVSTLAGGTSAARLGNVAYLDLDGFTVGTITQSGIQSSGTVALESQTGDITVAQNIGTTNTTTSAVVVNAGKSRSIGDLSGGNILVSGTPTVTTGTNGLVKFFSGRETESTGLTTLVGGASNVRTGVDESITTFSPVLSNGQSYALYRWGTSTLGGVTIVTSGGSLVNNGWEYANNTISPTSATAVSINASVIESYLASNPLTIQAGSFAVSGAIASSSSNAFNVNAVGSSTVSTTGDITVGSAVSLAGPATWTATGSITVNAALTTSSASDIQLLANAGFNTSNTRKDITSAGGNITIDADYDANGTGILSLDYLTLNPGAGTTTVRGATMNWGVSATASPWINGTGNFVFEPSAAAFGQAVETGWFEFDQDNNTIGNITFGKPTNTTQAVYFNHASGHAFEGNVTAYGHTVNVSQPLVATGKTVTLHAAVTGSQSAAITAASLELFGAGAFTLTNTSNNVATLAGGTSAARLGNVSYVDADGFTVGTVTQSGILSSGTVSLASQAGNITIAQNIGTTNTTIRAVEVNAASPRAVGDALGGNILISGSPTITTGTNGLVKLFSGREAQSTGLTAFAGGSSNVRYGVDESSSFSPTLTNGQTYALYRYSSLLLGGVTVVASGGAAVDFGWEFVNNTILPTSSTAVNIDASVIQNYLNNNPLTIEAGSFTVTGALASSSTNAFTVTTTGAITVNNTIGVAGSLSFTAGGQLWVNNTTVTSTGNGDVLLKSLSSVNSSVAMYGTFTKVNGTGTLTAIGNSRVDLRTGGINTSGTGVWNVVLWSDFDNTSNDGGVSVFVPISTNGGHVWLGGSNSNGGSYTWNGLMVGDGPSVWGNGYNANAMDIYANITTNGGDFLAWAGVGSGTSGIASDGGDVINTGSGDVIWISDGQSGSMSITSTGNIYLVPNDGAYASALTLGGTLSSGAFTFNTSHYNGVKINNLAAVGGLYVGRYDGMTTSGTPVVLGNTSDATVSYGFSGLGNLSVYGGAVTLSANLSTTGDVTLAGTTLAGTGNVAVASGKVCTVEVASASTYDGVVSGSGGFAKRGAGMLTLSKDHTYTGATTIDAGDLQVGTGGSLSAASSGTLAGTSGVVIASGSKLILAPNEPMEFSRSVSGAGSVEVKGMSGAVVSSFLTTSWTTLAANTTVLEALTRLTGGRENGYAVASGSTKQAGAYVKSYVPSSNTATLQMQQYDGVYTKTVFLKLRQNGTTTEVAINTTPYGTGAGYYLGNSLGLDMSTGYSSMGLATSTPPGTGYGIDQVYLSGKVNFTGTLTHTGGTTLSSTATTGTGSNTYTYTSLGAVEIKDNSVAIPGSVVNNGLVILNATTPRSVASNLSGTEQVLQVGAAVTLTGTNTHSGLTTVDLNKSLIVGAGGTSGSIAGNILNYGTVTFNRSDASTYPGVLSGTGSLVKEGSGELTVTATQTFTGTTTINGGTVTIQNNAPTAWTGAIGGAGSLKIEPSSTSFTSSFSSSGWTFANTLGNLTLGKSSNTQTMTVAATSVAGPITVYGGMLFGSGALSSSNSGASIRLEAQDLIDLTGALTTNNGAVVVWANKANSTSKYIRLANVTTNGGPLWAGGGSGSAVWNGLTVGNGFAVGNGLQHGISVNGMLDTRTTANPAVGGDILLVGSGDGQGRADISGQRSDNNGVREVYAGNGDITLLSRDGIHIYGGSGVAMALKTTGTLSFAPLSGSNWQTDWNFTGTLSGANMLGNNVGLWGIHIYDFANLGGLNIGRYDGTGLQGDNAYVAANTQNLTVSSNSSIAGPITLYGGTLTLNANLASASGDVSLYTNSALGGLGSARTVAAGGIFRYVPVSTSFSQAISYPITNLAVTANGLTLGKAGNTANITLASALNLAGPLEVYGGALTVSAGATAAGDMLFSGTSLDANGNLSTTGTGSDLTLDVATASVAPGSYIWTSGGITNNGALTLEAENTPDGAYAQMKFGGAYSAGAGSSISQQQYLEAGRHLMGAPFAAGTAAFFGGNNPGQGGVGTSGTGYPSGNMNLFGWSGSDWEPLASNASTITPGKGYIGHVGAGGFRLTPGIQSFTGTLPNATTTVQIHKSNAATGVTVDNENTLNGGLGLGRAGWNLVANPFPCAIDASGIAVAGKGLKSAVYRWNPRSNGNQGAYEAHSPAGSLSDNLIAPLQAFWVQSNSSGSISISMNDDGTVLNAPVFRKTTDFEADRFRFEAVRTASPTFKDVSYLSVAEGTSDGFDSEWDAHKLASGSSAVYLYSYADDGSTLANNAFDYSEAATAAKIMPMAFRAPGHGETYQITLDTALAEVSYEILLEDRRTGKLHNLKSDPYTFTNDTTASPERFLVHFRSQKARDFATMGGSEAPLHVWNRAGELAFWMNQPASGRYTLMGIDGKEYQSGTVRLDGSAVQSIPLTVPYPAGVYLVRTRLANGSTVFVRVML